MILWNRSNLQKVLEELRFPKRFINWLMKYITTVSYSILINGELPEPFTVVKGLRLSDPISPFLFAIIMVNLSRTLDELKEIKDFKFHPRCAKLGITHLSFTDDLLFFSWGNLNSISHIHNYFLKFSQA